MIYCKKGFEKVTILLPAMDETYSLEKTVDTIVRQCDVSDIAEIILLLCDKTAQETKVVASALVNKYSDKIHIYIHMQKLPFVGGAIREGINLAKGSHVIMMSSDLETDPALIPIFIEKSREFPDRIITASRWKSGGGFQGYHKIILFFSVSITMRSSCYSYSFIWHCPNYTLPICRILLSPLTLQIISMKQRLSYPATDLTRKGSPDIIPGLRPGP